MSKVISDLKKSKDISKNLPQYFGDIFEKAYRYSKVRLGLNFYSCRESIDENDNISQDLKDIYDKMVELLKTVAKAEDNEEKCVKTALPEVENLRNANIANVSILTAYTDIFKAYEYAMNRVEHQFDEATLPENYNDEAYTADIMSKLLSAGDNGMINLMISELVGQLPMRITKNKFFELLEAGLSIYEKGTKQSFDDFLYMVRSSSLLDTPDNLEKFDVLFELKGNFENTDFKNITPEEYYNLRNQLDYASAFLQSETDRYVMLQEIINDIYVVLLCDDHLMSTEYVNSTGREDELLSTVVFSEDEDAMMEAFSNIVGVQERLYEELDSYLSLLNDGYIESIANTAGKTNSCENIEKIRKIQALISGSDFIELSPRKDDQDDVVDKTYFEEQKAKLTNDLRDCFRGNERLVNRAIMAGVLAELPVFFNNINEVKSYVYTSLSACSNVAEKVACIELINEVLGDM